MVHPRRFVWLALTVAAGPALAHSPVPGIKGFYVGLLHPFSTPSQALLMLGSALLVGAFVVKTARWLMMSFLLASLFGLFSGLNDPQLDQAMFALTVVTCALAALLPGRFALPAIALIGLGGVLIGKASIPDDGPMRDRLFTMSGSIAGANLGLLYLFGLNNIVRERYRQPWVGIALRIAAAWLGAIALLMLALGFVEPPSTV